MWQRIYLIVLAFLKLLKRLLLGSAIITSLTAVSFFTTLFSKVGLFVLQHLPIPQSELAESPGEHATTPTAYVVLGGGLTEDKLETIVVNEFSESRLKAVLKHYQQLPLPIILTGVESPWMHDWLIRHDNRQSSDHKATIQESIISENASMNTCENARFTAKRLSLNNVYLVTDAYHMSRARRQFALNGITTTPINAALPESTDWNNIAANYRHSKRTLYEIGAYLRDLFFPQPDCRQAGDVSMETLMRSRKPDALKTF